METAREKEKEQLSEFVNSPLVMHSVRKTLRGNLTLGKKSNVFEIVIENRLFTYKGA